MDAALYRELRRNLLEDRSRIGSDLVSGLTELTFGFLTELALQAFAWPAGWALVAVGGTGRRELCPGSDIDLVILHPPKARSAEISSVSESLWYPIWDAGLKGTPSVHCVDSALALADREILSAATWLSATPFVGDEQLSIDFAKSAKSRWAQQWKTNLPELFGETRVRHARAGDVAFHLEPDLRDGKGGIRDVHVLNFCALSNREGLTECFERPLPELLALASTLTGVRAELHRVTCRNSDRLLLQEQDPVAQSLGYGDADELMSVVSAAGRAIAWSVEETTRRIEQLQNGSKARVHRIQKITSDIGESGGELVLLDGADVSNDPTLALRFASHAAQLQRYLNRNSLAQLAQQSPALPSPWPERARHALVALLGAGPAALHVLEALDQHDLLTKILPEWAAVRSKPQRNAYHRFTVDRHLCEAASQAAGLVRTVNRPDLLLVGTWLHDIGKGYPGDHVEVGLGIVEAIGARMGFNAADVSVLVDMERYHLLLPEVATRRDLSDPGTINAVAAQVKDTNRLELLRALTQADSIATGPTAWSDWKARLVDDLVRRTKSVLAGHGELLPRFRTHTYDFLLERGRSGEEVALDIQRDSNDIETIALVAPDQTGLFAAFAGALNLVGADILSADVWTTDDNYALDVFRITRPLGGNTDLKRLSSFISRALDGQLDVDAELVKRAKSYRRLKPLGAGKPAPASVGVDNDTPELATIFEVRAPDGPAVLYRVTKAISALGFDLRSATVSTIGHEVVDTFALRVVDANGRKTKLPDDESCSLVQDAILQSLIVYA